MRSEKNRLLRHGTPSPIARMVCPLAAILMSACADPGVSGFQGEESNPNQDNPDVVSPRPPGGTTPPVLSPLGYFDNLSAGAYCAETQGDASTSNYATLCAGCHGVAAEGTPIAPALANTGLDVAAFRRTVLEGRRAMPAFASNLNSESVDSIWQMLSLGPPVFGGTPTDPRCGHRDGAYYALDRAELERRYWAGLESFRRPGSIDQLACDNCHTFDGVDLARYGFRDSDILRRASMHTDEAHAREVLDFIHVLRAYYEIPKLLHPQNYRFLQPGGGVSLPGTTVEEREIALLEELRSRNIAFFKERFEFVRNADGTRMLEADGFPRLVDPAQVDAAIDELATLDLREIPNGMELNRWTEDEFNGPGNSTIAEWIPGLARVPRNRQAYDPLVDRYLRERTPETFWAIFDQIESLTDVGRPIETQISGGGLDTHMRLKYNAVQIAGYLFHQNDNTLPDPMINVNQFEYNGRWRRPKTRMAIWRVGEDVRTRGNTTGFVFGDAIHFLDTSNPGDHLPWVTQGWDITHPALPPGQLETRSMRGTWMHLGIMFEPHLMATGSKRGVTGGLEYYLQGLCGGQGVHPWAPRMMLHCALGAVVNTAAKARLERFSPREALLWGGDTLADVIRSLPGGAGKNPLNERLGRLKNYLSVDDAALVSDNLLAMETRIRRTYQEPPRLPPGPEREALRLRRKVLADSLDRSLPPLP